MDYELELPIDLNLGRYSALQDLLDRLTGVIPRNSISFPNRASIDLEAGTVRVAISNKDDALLAKLSFG